ncbi:MAG: uroporphyrinogen-III C-methyltransferase [Traorella sp.]
MGKVYLVGGGPGDEGLLTLKGYELIKKADCIVYDRLVNPHLLTYAKDNCELIYVGKKNHEHTMKQEDINQLLVDKACVYEHVVRLKGGDVYVFGRGGEEALFLRKHGIDFEVVPGISSSIAGLAYGGIPITHRGLASGFHVVSAHNRKDELSDIDFKSLAKSSDTTVFLMGLTMLDKIVNSLLKEGKKENTPIAIISNATLPTQKVITSTLADILQKVQKEPLPSPALIVVGDVVKLRSQLNFFEEKPLFGKKIMIPKVTNRISLLANQLKELGGQIEICQVSTMIENEHAFNQLNIKSFDWILFNSPYSVTCFMKTIKRNHLDIRQLHALSIAVIGESTAKELENYGIYPDIMPTIYTSEALIQEVLSHTNEKSRLLLPKGKGNDEKWQSLCEKRDVTIIPLYENIEVKSSFDENFDMIIFTCSSAVNHTLKYIQLSDKTKVFSIGEKTSQTLEKYSITNYYQSEKATYASLIERIKEVCIEEED